MPYQLHYFTLRLWLEDLGEKQGENQEEWRGEIRNIKTGETRYFRQGPMLLNLLTTMMDTAELEPEKLDEVEDAKP